MKKLVPYLAAAAIAAASIPAAAQDAGPAQRGERGGDCRHHHGRGRGHHGDPARHAEHRARMLTAILGLDAQQEARVRAILAEAAAQHQAIRGEGRSEATRERMHALREEVEQRIEAVLTAPQRETMARIRAERERFRSERRERHEAHGVDPRGI
jgi:hypothetical protein